MKNLYRWFFFSLLFFFSLRLIMMAVVPLTDQSEGRYASICRNMALSGNYLEPRFFHEGIYQGFDGKPPLYFWSGGLAVEAFGENELAVRLPSLLAALALMGLAYVVLRRYRNAETGLLAAFLLGSGGFFYLFSGVVITDMVLCLGIGGATICYMAFLAADSRRERKLASLGVFAFLAAGMLTKGPIAIALFGLPVFIWTWINADWKRLLDHAWIGGSALFLLLAAPWFVLQAQVNPDFLRYFFINENLLRFLSSEYGDRYGSGREFHYGAAIWMALVVNLPGVLIAAYALYNRNLRPLLLERGLLRQPVAGLAALSFLCTVGFWSLTSRTPIAYLLPTAPAFAILLADRIGAAAVAPWRERLQRGVLILGILSMTGLCAGLLITMAVAKNSPKTTRYILAEFTRLQQLNPDWQQRKLYFAGEIPYSADFYARNLVIQHPKEATEQCLAEAGNHIVVITARRLKRLPQGSYRLLGRSGGYCLVETAATPEKPE